MTTATESTQATRPSRGLWAAGLVLLAVAAGASLLLSIYEVAGSFNLPGCGPQSGCADIKNAEVFGVKVGMIPVVKQPVSFAGFAFFAAMLVAWIVSRRGAGDLGRGLKALAFFGGAVSVFYLAAMVIAQKFCIYCFTAHVCNLLFVGAVVAGSTAVGRTPVQGASATSGRAPLLAGLAVFVVSALALGVADTIATGKAEEKHADERRQTREEVIARARSNGDGESPITNTDGDVDPAPPEQPTGAQPPETGERFAGRWEMGPEKAPIRIVIFSDYQCDLCARTEKMLLPIVEQSDDIWLSVKHFPYCTDCNKYADRNMHPNACWAARAAETAGAIGGEEAFWKMHRWLFSRKGEFITEAELEQGIAAAGITDVAAFKSMFMDETRSLPNVLADIEEAWSLGFTQTPMVFINGVELRGMSHEMQLKQEIEALRAANLPARTAAADRPPRTVPKYVEIWREEARVDIDVDASDWSMGATEPKVDIAMWADYKFKGIPEIDATVRSLAGEFDWIRYTFRYYPLEAGCNGHLPPKPLILEGACRAALVAEAAGRVGGPDGFWTMHAWLMENQDRTLGDLVVKLGAKRLGLDGDAIVAMAADPALIAAIDEDASAKVANDVKSRMPLLFINGRVAVYRSDAAGEIIPAIVRAAYEEATQ